MSDRRREHRQPCELSAQIFVLRLRSPIRCTITDISTYGAFVRTEAYSALPANFDLAIGGGSLPRSCRVARREVGGLGVEFLDPVRREVEEILIKNAFKEELVFEALSSLRNSETTMTRVRLHRSVNAIMELIERRNAMAWQYADDRGELTESQNRLRLVPRLTSQ